MKIIKKLSEMIDDEVGGAIEYAKEAVLHKGDANKLGELFADLAEEELGHVNRLHEAVVKIINEAKESEKAIPAGMMEFYEYLHKRQIERVNDAKNYLEQFRA